MHWETLTAWPGLHARVACLSVKQVLLIERSREFCSTSRRCTFLQGFMQSNLHSTLGQTQTTLHGVRSLGDSLLLLKPIKLSAIVVLLLLHGG
jgi:hypothetical protein